MTLTSPYSSTKTRYSPIIVSDRIIALLQFLITNKDCEISRLTYDAIFYNRYLNPDKSFNYITFRETKGLISYQPYGKEQKYNDEGKWVRAGRQEIKPAKFVREFIHPRLISRFKDHEIAAFATRFKAFEDSFDVQFDIVDVEKAYNSCNFAKKVESCMMNKNVGLFFNSFGTKALVAKKKDGMFLGRALLWDNVKFDGYDEPQTFMDRVYSFSESITELFVQHATSMKYWYKDGQNNSSYANFINPNGEGVAVTATVATVNSVDLRDVEFFPYLDTFLYGDDNFSLTNKGADTSFAIYRETDGTREENIPPVMVIDYLGNYIPESEAILMPDGQNYHTNDPLIILAFDERFGYNYHFTSNVFLAANELYYTISCKNTVLLPDYTGSFYPRTEVVDINNKVYWIKSKEVKFSNYLGRYELTSELIPVYSKNWAGVYIFKDYYPKDHPDSVVLDNETYTLKEKKDCFPTSLRMTNDYQDLL